jgi:hypothetical protein
MKSLSSINTITPPILSWPFLTSEHNAVPPWVNPLARNVKESESTVDLLAVSAFLYRTHKDDPDNINRFSDLFLAAISNSITQEDHDMAEDTAQHFSKQVVMAQLRGEVSDFQRAVGVFLSGKRLRLEGTSVGLVYRLPEYYDMDTKWLAMRVKHFFEHEYVEVTHDFYTRKLIPIDCIRHHTQNFKTTRYWFKDAQTGNPVALKIDTNNQLKYIWDNIFNSHKDSVLEVTGMFQTRKTLGTQYMCSEKWKLEI